MKKHQMVVAACMLSVAVAVAGCTGSSSDLLAPDGSYLANGYGFGSGNRISDTTTTPPATPTTDATAGGTETARNGYGFGSGN